jgi:outer membrane autotransporter protein
MLPRSIYFPRSLISLAVLAAVSFSSQALAQAVLPGDTQLVDASTTPSSWELDNARLVMTTDARSRQITATNGSVVEISGGMVSASPGSSGVRLTNSEAVIDNAVILGHNSSTNAGQRSFGISLEGNDGEVGGGDGSSAIVRNSEVSGVGRGINLSEGSQITLQGTSVEGLAGLDAIGSVAGGVGLAMIGGTADVGMQSVITGDNNGVVIDSDNGRPEFAVSSFTLDNSSVVGVNGSAILVSDFYERGTNTTIDIANGSTLTGGNGVILEVEKAATATFNVTNSQLIGDVLVSDDSIANLSLANNASLTGTITNATSLNIDGTSAWVMEGDSTVGKLGLNGGSVDLRGTSEGFHTLNVEELSGAGTFALGTDLAAQTGDFLNVTGSATGAHQLLVQNTGVDPLQGAAPQQVVHTASGDAQFSLVGEKVDFGTFAYELQQQENTTGGADWSLVQTEEVSAASRSVIGLFSAAPTVWYGETTTLRSRMGEVRNGQAEGGGWMRAYGNKFNMSAGADVAYSQQQQGISFGADAPMKTSSGQWLVGLMGGYSKSDLDLKEGTTGAVDSYYAGAYSTWLAEDGFYVDALIKANRFQNSSDVVMRDGQKSKGKYTNHGVGASVEAGKHIKLNEEWFVEPYAQVTGLWVSGQDYHLNNGMDASSNKADSLLGKVGTSVGRKFALKDGGFVQPYVKVAAAHEFVTSNQVSINGNRFNNDLSGTRAELGAGVAAQVTEKLQLHADFDYMKGNNIEQPWGVNVGLRYNW